MSLQPTYQPLYPCRENLEDAIQYIQAQLPQVPPNRLYALLMTYHNTMIQELARVRQEQRQH